MLTLKPTLNDVPSRIRRSVADCLSAPPGGWVYQSALAVVQEWLEESRVLWDGDAELIFNLSLLETEWNDDFLREELGLDERDLVDDLLRLLFARERLSHREEGGTEENHPSLIRVRLSDGDDRLLLLGALITGDSISGVDVEWRGPYGSVADLDEDLRLSYLLEGDVLQDGYILAHWA